MKDLHLPDVLGHTTDEAIRRLQAAGAVCRLRSRAAKGIITRMATALQSKMNEVTLVAAAVRTEPKESGD